MGNNKYKILIVEDEANIRSRLVNMGKFIKLLQFGMEICGRRIYNRRLL